MDHLLPVAEQGEQDDPEEPGGSSSAAETAEQQRVEQLAKFQVRLAVNCTRNCIECSCELGASSLIMCRDSQQVADQSIILRHAH
jgi:hypothetical protein